MTVLVEITDLPRDVQLPNQPLYISVELDELVVRNFPVTVQVKGKAANGYADLPASVKPTEVILKGAARYIGSINTVAAEVDIQDAYSDIDTSLPIQILDKSGKPIPEIESNPKTVDIHMPIRKAKEVPIVVKTSGKLPGGFYLVGTNAEPSTVTITGEDNVLKKIDSIDTMPVSLDGIKSSTTKAVKLNLPTGVMLDENEQSVNVYINVEGTVSKTFEVTVPGSYANKPAGLNAQLITNTINVTLSGQESAIGKITASDIIVQPIDLAGAAEGESQYSVTLKVPAGVGIVEMNPQKVRVLITREQG
jgi:YbbR domain-containing protein